MQVYSKPSRNRESNPDFLFSNRDVMPLCRVELQLFFCFHASLPAPTSQHKHDKTNHECERIR